MNLQLLNTAEIYYQIRGFEKLSVPWLVEKKISAITRPKERRDFLLDDMALVASAEQSFLQMASEGKLKLGRYLATTPCFRDEPILDHYHQRYFLKTELIDTANPDKKSLDKIIEIALGFFSRYLPVEKAEQEDGSFDIVDTKGGIELGSYGIRETSFGKRSFSWIYATGCAEPRLSLCLAAQRKKGYHEDLTIAKSQIGQVEKIFEELHELQDAVLSEKKLLILCELADLTGAIKHYLRKEFGSLRIKDLLEMSRLTERAFLAGLR